MTKTETLRHLALLSAKKEKARRETAEELGRIGDPTAIPVLAVGLADRADSVRLAAVLAMGRLGNSAAICHLRWALSDPFALVRHAAASVLGAFGSAAASASPVLARMIKDESELVRHAGVVALGLIGGPRAVSALIGATTDQYFIVKRAAVEALGHLGPAAATAIPALASVLNCSELELRTAAARSMGLIGDSGALPALIGAQTDQHPCVRRAAEKALGALGHIGEAGSA